MAFTSKSGRFYGLLWSPDLLGAPDFIEIDDSVQEAAEGNLTTKSFPAPGLNYDPGNSSLAEGVLLVAGELIRRSFMRWLRGFPSTILFFLMLS